MCVARTRIQQWPRTRSWGRVSAGGCVRGVRHGFTTGVVGSITRSLKNSSPILIVMRAVQLGLIRRRPLVVHTIDLLLRLLSFSNLLSLFHELRRYMIVLSTLRVVMAHIWFWWFVNFWGFSLVGVLSCAWARPRSRQHSDNYSARRWCRAPATITACVLPLVPWPSCFGGPGGLAVFPYGWYPLYTLL